MPTQAEIKTLRSLANRKGRREHGRFLAEGVRLLEEADRHRYLPDRVYFAESELSERARILLDAFRLYKVDCQSTTARQIRQISDVKTTQGLVASFTIPPTLEKTDSLKNELGRRKYRKILLCDKISDPGNLGTLLRSALGFGFDLVTLTGGCVDPFSPKVVRSSVGAIFGLKLFETTIDRLLKLASDEKLTVIAADASGNDRIVDAVRVMETAGIIVAVGSEAEGLSSEIGLAARLRIRIPHLPTVESLNAGVAGSILMSYLYVEES